MKTLIKLLLAVAMLVTWASCDKRKEGEELSPNQSEEKSLSFDRPVTRKNITSTDLLNYYFTLMINEKSSLRILYFTKVNNQVQATMDNVQGRRSHPIDLKNNVLTFDADGDGKKVYKFKLTRIVAMSSITLSSFEYTNQDLDTVSLKYAKIEKVSAVKEFRNKVFDYNIKLGYSDTGLLFFTNTQFCTGVAPAVLTVYTPFYTISPGAWKGKLITGEDCIGVSTTSEGNRAAMWFQISGSSKTFFAREFGNNP